MTLASAARVALLMTLAVTPRLAVADDAIAGQWRTSPEGKYLIVMDVLADGHWVSQTVSGGKVIAEMAGSYQQTAKNATSGTIVWTPVKSKVTQEHGAASVETDDYTLANGGNTLTLVNQAGKKDKMVFRKQPFIH